MARSIRKIVIASLLVGGVICTTGVGQIFAQETIQGTAVKYLTYTFEEEVMGGQFKVPWTLTLNKDLTYTLVAENPMMGKSQYTGKYQQEGSKITTSPLQGEKMPIAEWFNADYSCTWYLEEGKCIPVKYLQEGEMVVVKEATYKDVAYSTQSKSQVCDIYMPEGEGPFPVIIVVHGGGFAFGSQSMGIIQPIFEAATQEGYAVVSVDYRKSSEAIFPAALSDVKAAIRFIRANSETYNFDSEHIAIWGESAGAYLALMTALTPEVEVLNGDVKDNLEYASSVSCLVDFYGPVEFYTMDEEYKMLEIEHSLFNSDDSFESKFLGKDIGINKEYTYKTYWKSYVEALPEAFNLSAWIQVGDSDSKVPYTQSQNFAARLLPYLTEGKVAYQVVKGAEHEDEAFYTTENLNSILAFLDTVMK